MFVFVYVSLIHVQMVTSLGRNKSNWWLK